LDMSKRFPMTSRVKPILFQEGWYVLLKRGLLFIGNLLFGGGTYLVYEFNYTGESQLTNKKPLIDCSLKIITSLSEYDELIRQGHSFGTRLFRPRLEKGAIAFCIFVDKLLVSEYWIATNAKAKKAIDPIPYKMEFAKGECCSGVRFTDPKYRRYGLSEYLYTARVRYLKEHNYPISKASVSASNEISQQMNAKLAGNITARGRYFHLFAWHYWKEKTVNDIAIDG
jgi:hypothetical protein